VSGQEENLFLFYSCDLLEGLYCMRPIQCLASSEIFSAGGGHTRWVERGWGSIVRKTPDTALHSIYVSTLCVTYCRVS
jgi:hypothetical protein